MCSCQQHTLPALERFLWVSKFSINHYIAQKRNCKYCKWKKMQCNSRNSRNTLMHEKTGVSIIQPPRYVKGRKNRSIISTGQNSATTYPIAWKCMQKWVLTSLQLARFYFQQTNAYKWNETMVNELNHNKGILCRRN